jgi:hypothetical protein
VKVVFKQTTSTDLNGLVQAEMTTAQMFFYISNSAASGTFLNTYAISLAVNTWTHFAYTLSGTTANFYCNGTLKNTKTSMTVPPAVNRTGCFVGYRPDAAADLSGYDEIRIYNRPLSAGEITTDFNTATFITFV